MMVPVRCEPKRHYAEMHPSFLCTVCDAPTFGPPGFYRAILSPESREARLMELGRLLLDETDDDFIPSHDCGYGGDSGYCRFHEEWFEVSCALRAPDGEKEQG